MACSAGEFGGDLINLLVLLQHHNVSRGGDGANTQYNNGADQLTERVPAEKLASNAQCNMMKSNPPPVMSPIPGHVIGLLATVKHRSVEISPK